MACQALRRECPMATEVRTVIYRGLGDNGAPWGPPTSTGNCTLGNLNVFGKCIPVVFVYGAAAVALLFFFRGK